MTSSLTFFSIGNGNTIPTLVWSMVRTTLDPSINAQRHHPDHADHRRSRCWRCGSADIEADAGGRNGRHGFQRSGRAWQPAPPAVWASRSPGPFMRAARGRAQRPQRRRHSRCRRRLGAGPRLAGAAADISTAAGCEAPSARPWSTSAGSTCSSAQRRHQLGNADRRPYRGDLGHSIVDTILKGSFFCRKAAIPALKARSRAISSISPRSSACIPSSTASPIARPKGGVVNLTRALAVGAGAGDPRQLHRAGRHGYGAHARLRRRRAATQPRYYRYYAELQSAEADRQARRVAESVVFVASAAACFMTGAIIPVDGGSVAGRL